MTVDEDSEFATALVAAARQERLSFEALVARVDREISQRIAAPDWLIEASLGRDKQAVLDALERRSGRGREGNARAARAEAVALATAVLDGSLSPILGARKLAALRREAGVPEHDPVFLTFVAIDSETDALPVGPVREHWATDALVRKEPDIARAEAWALTTGANAFRAVLHKWKAG